ncbi:MAG: LacI family DNA-binding transcriptional regulator [Bacillota bacterium]
MATMKDVAKASGVSIITVSRVINSPELVAKETRQKVELAMKNLGFLPNHAARALAQKNTRTVHLYVPRFMGISDPFMMNLIAGVSEELSKAYYLFLIRRDLKFYQRCDGVIVMGLALNEENVFAEELGVPFVLFGKTDIDCDCIDIDNQKGAFMVTDFVISRGHRRVGFLMMNVNQRYAYERLDGYRLALENAGIPYDADNIRYVDHSEQDACMKAHELFKDEKVTAIVCCNDLLAIGAFRAAEELRLRVPEDVSITGYDGLIFDLIPKVPLTTVRQPVYETGRALAQRLLKRLKNPQLPFEKTFIVPELVIRNSVGVVRNSAGPV